MSHRHETDVPLNRAKRLAKRLLEVAQEGPLVVDKLHHAQALTARLFGYPNWHALQQGSGPVEALPEPDLPWNHPRHNASLAPAIAQARAAGVPFTLIRPAQSPLKADLATALEGVTRLTITDLLADYEPLACPLGVNVPNEHLWDAQMRWLYALLSPEGEVPALGGLLHSALSRLHEYKGIDARYECYREFAPHERQLLGSVEQAARASVGFEEQMAFMTWQSMRDAAMKAGDVSTAQHLQALLTPFQVLSAYFHAPDLKDHYDHVKGPHAETLIAWICRRWADVMGAEPVLGQWGKRPLADLPAQVCIEVDLDPRQTPGLAADARWMLAFLALENRRSATFTVRISTEHPNEAPYQGPWDAAAHRKIAADTIEDRYVQWHQAQQGNVPPLTAVSGVQAIPSALAQTWEQVRDWFDRADGGPRGHWPVLLSLSEPMPDSLRGEPRTMVGMLAEEQAEADAEP